MTLARHPATEVLHAVLPPEMCRIVCEFAAPYAIPAAETNKYKWTRCAGTERLEIAYKGSFTIPRFSTSVHYTLSPVSPGRQYIAEHSPSAQSWHSVRETALCTRRPMRPTQAEKNARRRGKFAPNIQSTRIAIGSPLPHVAPRTVELAWCGHGIERMRETTIAFRNYEKWVWGNRDDPARINAACTLNGIPAQCAASTETQIEHLIKI
jgi:hypothetical protein